MDEFDIYFRGQLIPGTDPALARAGVAKMFKVEGDTLDRLFSGTPKRIKKAVDVDKASKYRLAFRKIGALVDIVPHGAPPPAEKSTAPAPAGSASARSASDRGQAKKITLELLPPHTGSLADCAPPAPQPELPDISGITMADRGVILDDTPANPPAEIEALEVDVEDHYDVLDDTPPPPNIDLDVSGLSALPANTGSLEDCRQEKEPQAIPATMKLELVD